MLVMAIVCQVKVNKYSDAAVQKGEIPKALHLIVDGQAAATLEDMVPRDAAPSAFCRGAGLFEARKQDSPPPISTNINASGAKKSARSRSPAGAVAPWPQHPRASYALFMDERRAAILESQPGASIGALSVQLTEAWRQLSDAERRKYDD